MKTIEERAKEYMPDAFDEDEVIPAREGYIVNVGRLAYIAGATYQQKIDRERVCKWICTNCECAENCEFSSPADCPTIKSITKAMEGEE